MLPSLASRLEVSKKPEQVLDKIAVRMSELLPQINKLKELQREYDELKQAIVGFADRAYEHSSEVSITGENIEIDVAAKDIVRSIKDMPGLAKQLGSKIFMTHATFPLRELDKLLSRAEQKPFVKSSRTGTRSVRVKLLE